MYNYRKKQQETDLKLKQQEDDLKLKQQQETDLKLKKQQKVEYNQRLKTAMEQGKERAKQKEAQRPPSPKGALPPVRVMRSP